MSRLYKAKHEEEQQKKQAQMRTAEEEEELYEENMMHLGGQNQNQKPVEEALPDLLACQKCHKFGHLGY